MATYEQAKDMLMDVQDTVRGLGGSIDTITPVKIGDDWRIAVRTFAPLEPAISNLDVAGVKVALSSRSVPRLNG